MAQAKRERPVCRAVCWLVAFGAAAALGYWLIEVSGQDLMQSIVLSIVTALLGGMSLRRLFCRPRKVRPGRVTPQARTPRSRRRERAERPEPIAASDDGIAAEGAAAAAGGLAAAAIRAEAAEAGRPVRPQRPSREAARAASRPAEADAGRHDAPASEPAATGRARLPDPEESVAQAEKDLERHLYSSLDELLASAPSEPRYASEIADDGEEADRADEQRPDAGAEDALDAAFEQDEYEYDETADLEAAAPDIVAGDADQAAWQVGGAEADDEGARPIVRPDEAEAAEPVSGDAVEELTEEIRAAVAAAAEARGSDEAEAQPATDSGQPAAEEADSPAPPATDTGQAARADAVGDVPAEAAKAAGDAEDEAYESDLMLVDGMDVRTAKALEEIGIDSLEALAGLGPKGVRKIVSEIDWVENRFTVRQWINDARALLEAEENG